MGAPPVEDWDAGVGDPDEPEHPREGELARVGSVGGKFPEQRAGHPDDPDRFQRDPPGEGPAHRAGGDATLRDAVYTLDACGYRDGPAETWEGRQFWGRFEDWRKRVRESDGKSRAPATDLYAKENRVLPASLNNTRLTTISTNQARTAKPATMRWCAWCLIPWW